MIKTELIPSITGRINCNKDGRKLLSLPPKLGGLDMSIFPESCQAEYENSVKHAEGLCTKIISETRQCEADCKSRAITNEIRWVRMEQNTEQLQNIRPNLSKQIQLKDLN